MPCVSRLYSIQRMQKKFKFSTIIPTPPVVRPKALSFVMLYRPQPFIDTIYTTEVLTLFVHNNNMLTSHLYLTE